MIRTRRITRTRSAHHQSRFSRKLWLQNLEDRSVPNTYTVNLLGDAGGTTGIADPMDSLKGDLRYCFVQANATAGDDTIQFDPTVFGSAQTITLSNIGEMAYNENAKLTINGPGVGLLTIAGNATASATNRIFNFAVAAGTPNIDINNLTLANGLLSGASSGGAILNADEVLSIANVNFTNNKTASTGTGGAVSMGGAMATFTDCNFTNNQTTGTGNGGAIAITATGGKLTVTNCTFSGNTTGGAGGAIQGGSTLSLLSITGSTFANNIATSTGGALNLGAMSGTPSIGASTFTSNRGSNGGAIQFAGAATVTINNATVFSDNKATAVGGAIHVSPASVTLNISNATFGNNTATTNGGAINTATATTTLNIATTTFNANVATGTGGAINTNSAATVTLNQATFTNNSSTGAGGAINGSSSINLENTNNSTFTGNKASSGGAMRFAIGATSVTLTNCTVANNTTTTGNGGAFEFAANGRLFVFNSAVHGNVAANGGGAASLGPVSFLVSNSTISGNTAKGANGGGAVFISGGGGGPISIRNTTITANQATGGKGGGFNISGSAPNASSSFNSTILAGNTSSVSHRDMASSPVWTINGANNIFGQLDTAVTALADPVNNQFGSDLSPVNAGLFPLSSFGGGTTMTHGLHYTSLALGMGYYPATPTPTFTTDQRGTNVWPTPGPLPGSQTDVGSVIGFDPLPFVAAKSAFTDITMVSDPNPYVITVAFDDETGINTATLGVDDIVVTGPQPVGPIVFDGFTTSGKQVTATYKFAAPGGSWDPLDTGVYSVSLIAGNVMDSDGTPHGVYGESIGSFKVGIVGKLIVDSIDDGVDGDYSAGKFTLREAIAIANAVNGTDTIEFSPSLNNSTITLTGEIAITNGVQINGPGSSLLSVSGAGTASTTNRIFNINVAATPATVSVSGLTLTGGKLSSGNGGAILMADEVLNASDVTFSNNFAAGVGGAIASTGTANITLTNSKMTGNSATGNGGAISMATSAANSLTLTNSIFSNNSSSASGGVLIGNNTITLNVMGSTFSNNTAVTNGGVFYMGVGTVDIKASTFTGNKATGASGAGAVINISQGSTYTISDSTFTGNMSGGSGGVVTAAATGAPISLTISNSKLNNNSSVTNGGAINMTITVAGSLLDIKTSTFNGNSGASGGALFVTAATTTITESTLSNNSATAGGGAIDTGTTAQVTFTNSTVSGNKAAGTAGGGGVRIGGAGALTLNLTTITNNSATNAAAKGGGVFINNASAVFQADGSIIAGNSNATNRDMSAVSTINLGGAYNLLGAVDPAVITVLDITNTQSGTEATPLSAGLFPLGSYGGPTQTHGLTYTSLVIDKGSNVLSIDHDQRGQPRDTLNPNLTDIGSFEGSLPIPFVTKVDPIADIVAAGTTPVTVVVTYDDETNIDTASLGADDISITGPGTIGPISFMGFVQSGKQVTATYQFAAPGGTWEAIENGIYNINVVAGKVFDLDGTPNSVLPGTVGSFRVNLTGPVSVVVDTIADENDGDQSPNDFSLREAIALANSTSGGLDTITFAPALNGQTITLSLGEMAINDSLLINGPGAGLLTINANNASRIFNISDGTATVLDVTIKGLTLTGGKAAGGGAIVMAPENVSLDGIVATLNSSTSLGGVVFFSTTGGNLLTINNSTFTNNTSTGNGGVVGTNGGSNTITINNSKFTGNTSSATGGVFDTGGGGGELNVTNSTFSGNSATGGGAVAGGYTVFNFTNCTLSGNTATTGDGGAAKGFNNHMIFTNCTIANNVASTGGGAISINSGTGTNEQVTLISSTVVNNRTTSGNGGGVRINSNSTAAGVFLKVINSIVSGNGVGASLPGTASDLFRNVAAPNNIADVNFSAIGTNAGFTLSGTSGNNLAFGSALNLGALQDNGGPTFTMAPLPGSPLIDAGDNVANALTTDQRGKARTYDDAAVSNAGDGTDIGAVEVHPSNPPSVTLIQVNGGAAQRSLVTSIKISFSEAVTFPAGINNAFVVERTGKGSLGTVNINAVQAGSDVTITFVTGGAVDVDPGNSLPDGQYKLTIIANNVMGAGGTLDGDADLLAEGSPTDDKSAVFHRLFGDGDGDGNVNSNDFAMFRSVFGLSGASIFDFNGDNNTNSNDFAEFRKRFGLNGYLP